MIDIVQTYWKAYLFSDGHRMTGLAMTLWLLVLSLLVGFLLAWPLAIAYNSRYLSIRYSARVWTFVFRGTPLYVQLLIVYTGIYSLSVVRGTPFLNEFFRNGFNCTILAFGLNTAAYAAEIFAGAIGSAPKGEFEACWALGMSKATAYRRVIIPLAFRRALPAYSNEVIMMLHSSVLAFVATVPDLFKITRDVNAATYRSFSAFGIAACLYLCLSFAIVVAFKTMERRILAFNHKDTSSGIKRLKKDLASERTDRISAIAKESKQC